MDIHRSFLALPVAENTRNSLRAWQQITEQRVRWTPFGNFHLTLFFFGDQGSAWLNEVAMALRRVPAPHMTMTLTHTTWLGDALAACGKDAEGIVELHQTVGQVLAEKGLWTKDAPFLPHVTLGRLRTEAEQHPPILPPIHLQCLFEPFTLYTVHRSASGTSYHPWKPL